MNNSYASHVIEESIELSSTVVDTIPIVDPVGDFLTDPNTNPFDIKPRNLTEEVEYDPVTNQYILIQKIGEEYYRAPSYMTFEEYLDWRAKEEERAYFQKLAGVEGAYKSKSGILDPISKIDIQNNLVDRLFGGTEVDLQPQGNIDLTIGWDYSRQDGTFLFESQRVNQGLDFDMDIKMNVDGQIGEKMKIGFNYDTQATFDFDRKIKLEYDTEQFGEDDIIKKIEAGNVSLPLRSSLIQGAQSLFGFKTELQFGRLRLTALASQQRSQNKSISIQNGSTETDIFLTPDQYVENKHFFLSHFNRQNFENALSTLPLINSAFKINNIEVWISDDRADYQQNNRIICALADLAEPNDSLLSNPNNITINNNVPNIEATIRNSFDFSDTRTLLLPDNRVNNLGDDELINGDELKQKDQIASVLKGGSYQMSQTRDFEVFQGRRLNSSEFSYNPQLGFISLNIPVRANQVVAVSYEYYYSDNCDDLYQVGVLSVDDTQQNVDTTSLEVQPQSVLFTKLLKSSNQRVDHPSWDLMMKNVYSIGGGAVNSSSFEFDIFFENDTSNTLLKFIPEAPTTPLLNLFELDRLNSFGDPQPDGIFDFVPGVTIVERTGSIIFPVLEPFGESIRELLNNQGVTDPDVVNYYQFNELYDTTVVIAREIFLEKNKFRMVGKSKGGQSSDISLGAWNIPEGSVTVRAGTDILTEGIDYDVDYGIGRIRIKNPAYLESGTPLNVSFEDNSLFSFQQRTMLGLRADYEVSDKLNLGATYLRLFERPFTEKVNYGDDPINNRIFGLDMNYSTESEAITRIVDKLPFYSTKEPSTFNFTAEVAAIKPGHSSAINVPNSDDDGGVVSIDDFEGAVSGFPLGSQPNQWFLASTPEYPDTSARFDDFPEGVLNTLENGANRALINWYIVDRVTRSNQDNADPYSRFIRQDELFDRQLPTGIQQDLNTFDITYTPTKRGPYNFDVPNGGYSGYTAGLDYNSGTQEFELNDPASRWAGIMRYFPNNDFQALNYETIEFWMLNPYMDTPSKDHDPNESGEIVIHLGSVSEDILNDNQQFFENTLPSSTALMDPPIITTDWANVPLVIPPNNAFDRNSQEEQDLGLDGADNAGEAVLYQDWVTEITSEFGTNIPPLSDPANDDWVFFNNPDFGDNATIFDRFERFNNPEGNIPDGDAREFGNRNPDSEDLNNNRSLDEGESFWEYSIPIENEGGRLNPGDNPYITESRTIDTDNGPEEWYRFRIPLVSGSSVNGIDGFRSIQFVRMITRAFETQKTFRFAEFEIVRNQWRRQVPLCDDAAEQGDDSQEFLFSVEEIGLQENTNKQPFGYTMPEGIIQEQLFTTFSNVLQDENSLAMTFRDLTDTCDLTMSKLTQIDLRQFKRMQMFVHAEDILNTTNPIEDGDMSVFIRFGKDFVNNYYEYRIPLIISQPDMPEGATPAQIVWREENMFNFPLRALVEAKKLRNIRISENGQILEAQFIDFQDIPNVTDEDKIGKETHKVIIKGNPNLAEIKGFMIGIKRNNETETLNDAYSGQVWVNELRISGLQERGGVAGLARMDIQLADLGNLSASANYSSIGFGALDQKVAQRQLDERTSYDLAANLELGKFFPSKWNLSVPFYAQYSKSIIQEEYDAYDRDLFVQEKIDNSNDSGYLDDDEKALAELDINDRNKERTTIRSINFTNVRKNRGGGGANRGKDKSSKPKGPKPWDIENVSATYAYSETTRSDFLIQEDKSQDYKVGLYYDFSTRPKYIQPFKKIKSKYLKLISEFNFNLIPQSFSFGSEINRFKSTRLYREPDTPEFVFNDQRFNWTRDYDLKWDFTKAIKMTFQATHEAIIDEYRQVGIAETAEERAWVDERGRAVDAAVANEQGARDYWRDNIRDFGRPKNYSHNLRLSYNVPMKNVPGLDWISLKGQYDSRYDWAGGSLQEYSLPQVTNDELDRTLGNIITNSQNRSLNAGFKFDKLYSKIGYLKRLEGRAGANRRTTRRSRISSSREDLTKADDDKSGDKKDRKKDGPREISFFEKLLIRPLLSLRSVDVNYKESFETVIPGFKPTPQYLGVSNGFDAPGLGFAFGLQPDFDGNNPNNWFVQAEGKDWITRNPNFNQEFQQYNRQTFDAKVKLEPWKDVRIDLKFTKNYDVSNSQFYRQKDTLSGFQQFGLNEFGSYDVTFFSLNTLFNDGRENLERMFNDFEEARAVISQNYDNDPNAGTHVEDGSQYANGYGGASQDVLIPAFLAIYRGRDVNTVDLSEDLTSNISKTSYIPAPNWTLSYSGLSKLDFFKDFVKSFTVQHGYNNNLRVSRFNNDLSFDPTLEFQYQQELNMKGDYYSRIEIPNLSITERFEPLIGIELKTVNDANFTFRYTKSRTLDLLLVENGLNESRRTEFILGLGFTFRGVNIGFLTGDKGGKSRGRSRDEADNSSNQNTGRNTRGGRNDDNNAGVNDNRGRNLLFNLDFKISDDVTYNNLLDSGQGFVPIRGTKTITISPYIDYEVNQDFTLQFFFDYQKTSPYTLGSNDRININSGFKLRFNLN